VSTSRLRLARHLDGFEVEKNPTGTRTHANVPRPLGWLIPDHQW
jgi:hypothetical protein